MSAKIEKNGRLRLQEDDHYPELRARHLKIVDGAALDPIKPFLGYVSISPETARKWLALNIENRRLRVPFVNFLVRQILDGEWQEDHPQAMIFSDAGRVISGQHRLHAIVKADRTVIVRLECGVRDGLREYIDTGISRALEDRVQFDEDSRTNRRLAQIVTGWYITMASSNKYQKFSPEQAKTIFQTHEAGIRFGASVLSRCVKGISRTPIAIAAAQAYERNPGFAQEFVESLCAVAGLATIQPAAYLKQWIAEHPSGGGGNATRDMYCRTVWAMKMAMAGKDIKALHTATWD